MINIQKSKIHGKGVFSTENILNGEIIEVCEIIKLQAGDIIHIDETNLYNYYFDWENNMGALALGGGSLYNHSYQPNAKYFANYKEEQLVFQAIRDIHIGEEISVNYNGNPDSQEKLWFNTDIY